MDNFTRFVPITKKDDDKKMVYGWASTPDLDTQDEIVTVEAMKAALPNYLQFPTIREMHQPKAIGITKETSIDSKKGLYIGAKIVDADAWEKVKEGVYKGFSIGGRIKNKVDKTIHGLDLSEISLVDTPANKQARITVFKRDNTEEVDNNVSELQSRNSNMLKGYKKTFTGSPAVVEEFKKLMAKSKKQEKVVEEVKETPEEVKEVVEETKEEVKEEVKTEEPKVVVDEAKQVSDEPEMKKEDEEKDEVMEKLEKMDKVLSEPKEEKEEVNKVQKVDRLEGNIAKMTSVIEKLVERVSMLESQPAAPKTKASFIVNKGEEVIANKESGGRLTEVNKRLSELEDIRYSNLEKFQMNHQSEAFSLLDEKKRLEK